MGGYGSGRQRELIPRETTEDMLALDIRVLKKSGSLTKSSKFSFEIRAGVAKITVGNGGFTPTGKREYQGRTNRHTDAADECGRLLCQSEGSHVNLLFPTYMPPRHSASPLVLGIPKHGYYASTGGYRVIDQRVTLTSTPCALGGHRLWWRCPCCEKRVAILYLRLIGGPTPLGETASEHSIPEHWWGHGFFACRQCLDLVYASQYQSAGERCQDKAIGIRIRLGATLAEALRGVRYVNKPKGMHYKTYFRWLNEMWWRDEVFMAEVHQQFARYEMLAELDRLQQEKRQQARLKRQLQRQKQKQATSKQQSSVKIESGEPLPSAPNKASKANSHRTCKIARRYWKYYAPLVRRDHCQSSCCDSTSSTNKNKQQSIKAQVRKANKSTKKYRFSNRGTHKHLQKHRSTIGEYHQAKGAITSSAPSVALPKIRVSLFKRRLKN